MSDLMEALILFAQQDAVPGGLESILPIAPWIMIGVLFYLILIRPERRKRDEMNKMLKELKKNDRVVTIGGIFGTVVQASQDAEDITLKIDESNNTRIRVLRSSISRVVNPDAAPDPKGT